MSEQIPDPQELELDFPKTTVLESQLHSTGTAVTAGFISSAVATVGYFAESINAGIVAGGSMLAYGTYNRGRQFVANLQTKKLQNQLGEVVEVQRPNGLGRTIRWHPAENDRAGLDDRIRRLAYFASRRVATLAIDSELINSFESDEVIDVLCEEGEPAQWSRITFSSWHSEKNEKRTMPTKTEISDTVTAISPYHLAKTFEPYKTERIIHERPIVEYLSQMEALRPGNGIGELYQKYADHPELQEEKLTATVRSSLEARLFKEEFVANQAFGRRPLSRQVTGTKGPRRDSSQYSGYLRTDQHTHETTVMWRRDYGLEEQALLKALDITPRDIEAFEEDMYARPHKSWDILLAKVYDELQRGSGLRPVVIEDYGVKTVTLQAPPTVDAPRNFSSENIQSFDLSKDRWRHARALVLGAVAGAIFMSGTVKGFAALEASYNEGGTSIADPVFQNRSSVGNTAKGSKVQTDWQLESHGMPTDGYWATRTGNEFFGGSWINKGIEARAVVSVPEALPASTPSIKVTYAHDDQQLLPEINSSLVAVPVRENTRISAATVNDRPTSVVELEDGTQGLYVPAPDSKVASVTYWLTEDSSKPIQPKFVHSPQTYGNFADIWRATAGISPSSAEEQAEYIRNNFEYTLSPVDDPALYVKPYELMKYALEHREAKCDLSATIVALSSPTEVSYAEGYNEKDSNARELASNEGHAWNVNGNGEIIDATPPDRDGDAQAYLTKKPEHSTSYTKPILQGIAGAAALAAAGYSVYRFRNRRISFRNIAKEKIVTPFTDNPTRKDASQATLQNYTRFLEAICYGEKPLQAALHEHSELGRSGTIKPRVVTTLNLSELIPALREQAKTLPKPEQKRARKIIDDINWALRARDGLATPPRRHAVMRRNARS